jgi:solute carrier family 13 (sodium-dependent dicarboxylate transporter), member 2/3/5
MLMPRIEKLNRFSFVVVGLVSFLVRISLGSFPDATANLIAALVFIVLLWVFEIVPIAITALMPVLLFPGLGILNLKDTVERYSHPIMFLFLGGFSLALAVQKSGLHRRFAFYVLTFSSPRLGLIIATFMGVTAFLSMWISNSATAIMMLPVALAVCEVIDKQLPEKCVNRFRSALMLSIAYSANIGGVATLIGSPPNALYAAFMKNFSNTNVTFLDWMFVGLPVSLVLLPFAWFLLTKILYPMPLINVAESRDVFKSELKALGKLTSFEMRVGFVFLLTVFLWLLHPLMISFFGGNTKIDDSQIAIAAMVSLFLIPRESGSTERLIGWKVMRDIPWEILLLFGGGLAIAHAIGTISMAGYLSQWAHQFKDIPLFVLIFGLSLIILFMTEITSNTATAAVFLPIASSLAAAIGLPTQAFVLPVALASSCAFMLPIATPPNAIVYGTGTFTMGQMAKAGLALNIVSALVIASLTMVFIKFV